MELSSRWTELLLERSYNLTKHCFIKDLFYSEEFCGNVQKAFLQFERQHSTPLLRIYVNNGHRYDLLQSITGSELGNELSKFDFETALRNTLKNDKFCITVNGLTRWNSSIDHDVRNKIVNSLIDEFGLPARGIDSYAFIGNYGYTPFGIHDDDDHSMLFHMGPGSKKVWILPRKEYIELNGDEAPSFDYDNYLEHFDCFSMSPGDFVFIPKGDFHVFKTDNFSITLGLTIFPKTGLNQFNDLVEEIDRLDKQCSLDVYFSKSNSAIESFDKEARELANQTLQLRRRSNDYLTTLPLLRNEKVSDSCVLFRSPTDKVLALRSIRKDYYFVKGRHFSTKTCDEIYNLIQMINRDKEFSIWKCSSEYNLRLEKEVINSIFEILVNFGFLHKD